MNIYLCVREDDVGYDEYDSFVCVAETVEDARNMQPDGQCSFSDRYTAWAKSPEMVTVYMIGKVDEKSCFPKPIVCASFNAG